jgi:8-oxo-dGTP pyrophosphatase MutT (NUDIX family)
MGTLQFLTEGRAEDFSATVGASRGSATAVEFPRILDFAYARSGMTPRTPTSLPLLHNITNARVAERVANAGQFLRTHEHDLWHQYKILPEQEVKHAAVLVPLVERDDGVYVLLTQRTTYLNGHAGQISFPGGSVEARDRHRQDTALRETEEEIGLARSCVTVLGQLPEYEMQSGFRITPVVGWVQPPYSTRPDPLEVQDISQVSRDSVSRTLSLGCDGGHALFVLSVVTWLSDVG